MGVANDNAGRKATVRRARFHPALAVALAALIAGTLDITDAIIAWSFKGATALRIFQSVARGVLGEAAFEGGIPTAVLGGALHYFISLVAAAAYYLAALRAPALVRRPVVFGLLYGAAVFIVMNYAVVPLSAVGRFPSMEPLYYANAVFANVALFGLPIALVISRFLTPRAG